MRNLRVQLLFSHLLLVLLMMLVIVGGVVSVFHLGQSIDRILKDNYKSVVAAQDMKEALERQDSATTFFLAGQVGKARAQYTANRPKFEAAFSIEDHNITERGERQMADDIRRLYADYSNRADRLLFANPPIARQAADDYYFSVLEPMFLRLKQRCQDVLKLNQDAIVRADARAKREAKTASWTGIVVATVAFVLATALALRMVRAALAPLLTVARQAEEIGAGHLNQRIELHRTDEIGALAVAFNTMGEKLQAARQIEEERLRRAERMSDVALDSLYDPVIVTDARGHIVHLNRAAEGLFGAVELAKGQPAGKTDMDARIVDAIERAVRQERVSAQEGEAGFIPILVGSSQRTYRLRATPMHDEEGSLLGAVAVLEDVTHLRELDRLKTEFIGVASHELRTPVTSLMLSVQLLEEGAVGELTEDQKQVVAAQKEDLQRLERMMGDLLDLTRLEAGVTPPRFEFVDPADLVRGAGESVASQAEAREIAIVRTLQPDLPEVRADRSQIVRVLVNLLSNAIRHTPDGGTIALRAEPDGGRVRFTVSDSGPGIPPEYLDRVFDRFVQVPGATRGGAGLGLSIAQTVVRAHGGEIVASSVQGEGSTFTFALPAGDVGRQEAGA